MRVIFSTPNWSLSGVNSLTSALARGLRERGFDPTIVLTVPDRTPGIEMPRPQDIELHDLPVRWYDSVRTRWRIFGQYLRDRAPCIYVPGYDWLCGSIVPALPPDVRVVAGLYSDEDVYYQLARRLGDYCDAIVPVSNLIADRLVKDYARLTGRTRVILNGVPWSEDLRARDHDDPMLRVVFAARLAQYQKRVMDLSAILDAADVPIELTVIGDGPQRDDLRERLGDAVRFEPTLPLDQLRHRFAEHDVFLLTSDFEGIPLTLLEAMSAGCVPVVTEIQSGIPEVVDDGVNGFRVPVGDARAFAGCLSQLHQDRDKLGEMRLAAHGSIREKGFREQDMCDRYADLFRSLADRPLEDGWQRPAGPILPPAGLLVRWTDYLPRPVRKALLSLRSSS